jgi:ABC-type branched-subunit amino acid transport system substrate-binding protein
VSRKRVEQGGRRRAMYAVLFLSVLSLVVAAAAGASPRASTLNVAVFEPFAGPLAAFGPNNLAGCMAGAKAIDDAGGVLGHQMACQAENSTGDPADAVPAANKMLTSVSNLVAIIGPGGETPATFPLIAAAKIVDFSLSGSDEYDKNTSPWFFRMVPADGFDGIAMAYWAAKHGYKHAASVFTNDASSQTIPGPLAAAYKSLGGHLVKSVTLAPGQNSYRTEASQLLAAHPDAVFTETDPQTAATFWSEMLQIGGRLPPILGPQASAYHPYLSALLPAVGHQVNYVILSPTTPSPSAGLAVYKRDLLSASSKVKKPAQYDNDPFAISDYDAVTIVGLAMTEAKSTDPSNYRAYITKVAQPASAGTVVVHTYAQGIAALKAGKKIRYSGAGGPIVLNKYHNVAQPYAAHKLNPKTGKLTQIGAIPQAVFAKVGG